MLTGVVFFIETFMVVNCGSEKVDLTMQEFSDEQNLLGEIVERKVEHYGGNLIDIEFKNYLRRKLGEKPWIYLKKIIINNFNI